MTDGARRCRGLGSATRVAGWIARWPQPRLLRAGAALAWVLRPWLGTRRRIAERNLALCFPQLSPPERARLCAATVRATATGLLESLRGWFAPAATLRPLLAGVEGLEHVVAAQAAGRGVLLLTGHAPQLELGGRLLALALDQPLEIVVRRHGNACLERFVDRARRRAFAATVGKKDTRALLRSLAGGRLVAMAADQDFAYRHVFVPFFGVPAATLAALPDIAARGGADVLFWWCAREPDGRYRLQVQPPWTHWPSGDATADAARYMQALEAAVRAHPEQYLWVHRRFKTRPAGTPDRYA
jgi:KDO2-lipid IV(A) lauroyltransferase